MKKRVLIVDDDESIRKLALRILSDTYDCDTAVDALDAYSKIWDAIDEDNPYDVITLDEIMPDIDGISLLRILKINEAHMASQKDKPLKFIIISGSVTTKYLRKMYKAVMENRCVYIKKPFNKALLLETIDNLTL